LSIVATKFAGSILGAYVPWIGARAEAEVPRSEAVEAVDELPCFEEPQAAASNARIARATSDTDKYGRGLSRPVMSSSVRSFSARADTRSTRRP
jgi:hypothetical protein